jgi:hypothetical protein
MHDDLGALASVIFAPFSEPQSARALPSTVTTNLCYDLNTYSDLLAEMVLWAL